MSKASSCHRKSVMFFLHQIFVTIFAFDANHTEKLVPQLYAFVQNYILNIIVINK